MCRTTTNTNRWKSIDSVCLQFRLRGCDNLDQNLHPATLHTHFRSLRHQISFPALDGSILSCGISCHFCHRHGKLLQAGLILLDKIRRQHGGKLPTEHRTILCRHGHYQPFIDFFILIFPIPSILRLQMSTRKKAGVCGIMLLGGL